MTQTPHEAFSVFLEKIPGPASLAQRKPEEFLEALDAFLVNPERHREHVRQIVGAYAAAQFVQSSGFGWILGGRVGRLFPSWGKQLVTKLQALKGELLQELQPGEFMVDILPSRPLVTHEAWLESYDCHLVEIRAAIQPTAGFAPGRVGLTLMLDDPSADPLRFIDCFPSTELAEIGETEIGLSGAAKFTSGTHGEISATAAVPIPGLKVSGKGGAKSAYDESSSRFFKQTYRYSTKITKLVSSAVGRTVRWNILRTGDEAPTGGLSFLATLMIERGRTAVRATGALEVELDGWGTHVVPIEQSLVLLPRTRTQL